MAKVRSRSFWNSPINQRRPVPPFKIWLVSKGTMTSGTLHFIEPRILPVGMGQRLERVSSPGARCLTSVPLRRPKPTARRIEGGIILRPDTVILYYATKRSYTDTRSHCSFSRYAAKTAGWLQSISGSISVPSRSRA